MLKNSFISSSFFTSRQHMGWGKIRFDKQIRVIMDFKVLTKKNNCTLQLSGWGAQ
jgi:hypothetical protein